MSAENKNEDLEKFGLLIGVLLGLFLALLFILFISVPILIGFAVGFIIYSSALKNESLNIQKLLKVLFITLICYLVLLGVEEVPYLKGILFTYLLAFTKWVVATTMNFVNNYLPHHYQVKSISLEFLRKYLYFSYPASLLFIGIKIFIQKPFLKNIPKFLQYLGFEKAEEGLYLGDSLDQRGKKFVLTPQQLGHHIHVLGASGFGKSVLLMHIIEHEISQGHGLFYIDLKSDNETIKSVFAICKKYQRLDDLLFLSSDHTEMNFTYNVLETGNATQLKDRILSSLNWSEEFYKNESSSFLLKLLRGLVLLRDEREEIFNLKTIYECTEKPDSIDQKSKKINNREIKEEMESLSRYLRNPETFKNLQGLRAQLQTIIYSEMGSFLCPEKKSQINILEASQKGKIVFILLNSRNIMESARAIGKMILQDLKSTSSFIDSYIEKEQRKPFTVIVDEFSDLAQEGFLEFLDRARSSRMGTVISHQELGDLRKVSPEFSDRLMQLCSTHMIFLSQIPETAEKLSGLAGTRKSEAETRQMSWTPLLGNRPTNMKSVRDVESFMIHPNTIKNLSRGECVVISKIPTPQSGKIKVKPFICDTSNIYLKLTRFEKSLLKPAVTVHQGSSQTRIRNIEV